MNLYRYFRRPRLLAVLAILPAVTSSALAGDHNKVLLGYTPVYQAYPYAYATAPYLIQAPVAGYYAMPYGATAAAPAPAYTPAPAPAPATGWGYAPGYYGYYNYPTTTPAAAPALAGSPAMAGAPPAPLPAANLTDPVARKAIVDQLTTSNNTYLQAKLTDDVRATQLDIEAKSLYAGKRNVSVDALTSVDLSDAKNLLAAATGAVTATPANAAASNTAAAAPAFIPVVPVYGKPAHHQWNQPWLYSHPRLYNLLAR